MQIPVRVGDVGVAEVGAERDDMATDSIVIMPALLKRAHGEGVPQIVNAGSRLTGFPSQAGRSCKAEEDGDYGIIGWRRACINALSKVPTRRRADKYRSKASHVVRWSGSMRLFWNLVCRMIRPSAATSSS